MILSYIKRIAKDYEDLKKAVREGIIAQIQENKLKSEIIEKDEDRMHPYYLLKLTII